MKEITYSEIFHSMQGEGNHTGKPSVWLRFFLCNLQCDGFGQCDPTDPLTYELPYANFDTNRIQAIEELPVWTKGCDSSYSWASRFKHLQKKETPADLAEKIIDLMRSEYNPHGKFVHPSGQDTHMCFTGGEPMLNQQAMMDLLEAFDQASNFPYHITVETNGTRKITFSETDIKNIGTYDEWFWSISPKLFHTSGEPNKRALKPEIIKQYWDISNKGQLKFVVDKNPKTWDEMEEFVKRVRNLGVDFPVWVMPVGSTVEGQNEMAEYVADEALKRGYNFSARLHNYVYGNAIGK